MSLIIDRTASARQQLEAITSAIGADSVDEAGAADALRTAIVRQRQLLDKCNRLKEQALALPFAALGQSPRQRAVIAVLFDKERQQQNDALAKGVKAAAALLRRYVRKGQLYLADAWLARVDEPTKRALLSTGGRKGRTALHYAVKKGQGAMVRRLIAAADTLSTELLSATDHKKRSALHLAVKKGRGDAISAILQSSASDKNALLSAVDQKVRTALHHAAMYNKDVALSALLQEAEDKQGLLCATDVKGRTALHLAAKEALGAVVQRLIEAADTLSKELLSAKDYKQRSALHLAAKGGGVTAITAILQSSASDKNALLSAVDQWGRTALHLAAKKGRDKALRALLQEADDKQGLLTVRDDKGRTALHLAARRRRLSVVGKLLNIGGVARQRLLAARDNDGRTALHHAVSQGNQCIVEFLLQQAGAAKEELLLAVDGDGRTPLHLCALERAAGCARILLREAGAAKGNLLTAQDHDGLWPFIYAEGDVKLQPLLTQGLDDADRTFQQFKALVRDLKRAGACDGCSVEEVQRLLIQHPHLQRAAAALKSGLLALPQAAPLDPLQQTVLNALFEGELRVQRAALSSGLSAAKRLLFEYIRAGDLLLLDILLANSLPWMRQALLRSVDDYHSTPLHRAATTSKVAMASLLLAWAVPSAMQLLLAQDDEGETALHDAVRCGDGAMAAALLAGAGAEALALLTAQDSDGFTPLHRLASNEDSSVAKILLAKAAEDKMVLLLAVDRQGRTALHHAAYWGNGAMVRLLLSEGAAAQEKVLWAKDSQGDTPLHLAARVCSDKAVEILLFAADSTTPWWSLTNNGGSTPLHEVAKAHSTQGAAMAHSTIVARRLLAAAGASKKRLLLAKDSHNKAPFCYAINASPHSSDLLRLLLEGVSATERFSQLANICVALWQQHGVSPVSDASTFNSLVDKEPLLRGFFDQLKEAALRLTAAPPGLGPQQQTLWGLLFAEEEREQQAAHGAGAAAVASLLHRYVRDGHLYLAVTLLQGADPATRGAALLEYNGGGLNPLHSAIARTQKGMVKLLINHAGDARAALLAAKDIHGNSPLHRAAMVGNRSAVRHLLNAESSSHTTLLMATDDAGDIALHKAAEMGLVKTTKLLLDKAGPSCWSMMSQQGYNGSTALHRAAAHGRKRVTRLLLERAGTAALQLLLIPNQHGYTALHSAVSAGKVRVIDVLLDGAGTDYEALLSAKDSHGMTALHGAARARDGALAKLLIGRAAVHKMKLLTATDNKGKAPFYYAVSACGSQELIAMLLEGIDVPERLRQLALPMAADQMPLARYLCSSGNGTFGEAYTRLQIGEAYARLQLGDGPQAHALFADALLQLKQTALATIIIDAELASSRERTQAFVAAALPLPHLCARLLDTHQTTVIQLAQHLTVELPCLSLLPFLKLLDPSSKRRVVLSLSSSECKKLLQRKLEYNQTRLPVDEMLPHLLTLDWKGVDDASQVTIMRGFLRQLSWAELAASARCGLLMPLLARWRSAFNDKQLRVVVPVLSAAQLSQLLEPLDIVQQAALLSMTALEQRSALVAKGLLTAPAIRCWQRDGDVLLHELTALERSWDDGKAAALQRRFDAIGAAAQNHKWLVALQRRLLGALDGDEAPPALECYQKAAQRAALAALPAIAAFRKRLADLLSKHDTAPPDDLLDPFTFELMDDPVALPIARYVIDSSSLPRIEERGSPELLRHPLTRDLISVEALSTPWPIVDKLARWRQAGRGEQALREVVFRN